MSSPHNVQVSPNGRTMWAVSGSDSLAAMVDTKTLGLHGTVPTGGMPAHLVLSPDGRTAYTTNGADNSVSAIDTKTMKPVATIPVGSGPHGLRPRPDGKWVYVANIHVQNLDDFAALNKAYAVFFDSPAPPARATVRVARLPRGALVEISAMTVR